jgi:hypothetical protein
MEIPRCNCSKFIPYPRKDDDGFNDFKSRPIVLKDTLCDEYAFVRGAGQSIVAFTFYEPPILVSNNLEVIS